MNFIQKRIQQKKLEQEEQIKEICSYSIFNVEKNISYIKSSINYISDNQKNITPKIVNGFIWNLERLESCYNTFLHDLKQEEFTSKRTWNKKISSLAKQKAEYMHNLKKQYRVEFEKIYRAFKRVTKGQDCPRRNEILGLMRKAFDFDSSKYYAPDQFTIIR